jgi:NAD(P)-dependent dehydrogenase (short-subunit alcohol dehydrogenase family)
VPAVLLARQVGEVLPRYQPLPLVGTVDDIAQAALFLAGDASRLVSGHDLVVDGGISAGWPVAAVHNDRARFFKVFQASGVRPDGAN